jgi:hypothetical protein
LSALTAIPQRLGFTRNGQPSNAGGFGLVRFDPELGKLILYVRTVVAEAERFRPAPTREIHVKSMKFLLGVATLCAVSGAQVVINEIQYDDTGTDDREYVELYNKGTAAVDISGWILRSWDLTPGTDNNPDYVIPGAVGSATTVIAPGGYYVMGSPLVANVNQVLVNGAASTNLFENDIETTALVDGTNSVVDSVTYEGSKAPTTPAFPIGLIEGSSLRQLHGQRRGPSVMGALDGRLRHQRQRSRLRLASGIARRVEQPAEHDALRRRLR